MWGWNEKDESRSNACRDEKDEAGRDEGGEIKGIRGRTKGESGVRKRR